MKKYSNDIFDLQDFPMSFVRRTVFQGTGTDMDELTRKPLIAIINSHTDINPGHMHLKNLAERVKEGVHAGGAIPFECNVPAACDGIAMGHDGMKYILAQRDLIADIVETHVRSMRFDGVVLIASCDKIIPGMIMAAGRLDLPTVFVTGGSNNMQIRYNANRKESVSYKDYKDNFDDMLSAATCATCGACEIMGTANTFQCLTEALGLSLPGSAVVPAFHSEKLLFARKAGLRICEMVEEQLTAGKLLTEKALENALMVDLAIGGSTNATLHLPAIARASGFELPLSRFNDFNQKIPTLCAISPNGPYGVTDLYIAGGIPAVMKQLRDDLHLDALNANGTTLAEIVEAATVKNETVIPGKENAHRPEGGTVILYGNLAPDGAVVKQSAVAPEMHSFTGAARVFDSEGDCLTAIREKNLNEGEVIVIRYVGPRGGPGMPEMLAVTMALETGGYKQLSLVTDGRFSGASSGPCVGHISPEAAAGGPIAAIVDGDKISIDIPSRSIKLHLSADEITERLKSFKPPQNDIPRGFMQRYVKTVGSASEGAILE